jgi:hypothetical protein
MKRLKNYKIPLLLAAFIISYAAYTQDSIAKQPVLDVSYFSYDNHIPYVHVMARLKQGRKFEPVKGVILKVYLDSVSSSLLMTDKAVTDETGKAEAVMPASLQTEWNASANHKFIAEASGVKEFEGERAEAEITKARLLIDTATGSETKNVIATFTALENGEWIPVKDVDIKIAVKRMGGTLTIGEEATYATDSSGTVAAEFKRDSIPGDANGNIVLIATVEDNDKYGNLSVEKTAKWGAPFTYHSTFNERSLFASRNKTPVWLLFMAYFIIGIVWGTLIYLVFQIFKIKKLGKQAA